MRDNIHSTDVANFIFEYFKNPRIGEVYNIGGGYDNSISILEAIDKIEQISSLKQSFEILEEARIGIIFAITVTCRRQKNITKTGKLKLKLTQF